MTATTSTASNIQNIPYTIHSAESSSLGFGQCSSGATTTCGPMSSVGGVGGIGGIGGAAGHVIYPSPTLEEMTRIMRIQEALKNILNGMDESEQIRFVLLNPDLYDMIDNPSKAVQNTLQFKAL